MCPDQDPFTTYEEVFKGVTVIYNNKPRSIASIRSVKIKLFDGSVKRLNAVRHVPNAKKILIF